MLVGLVTVAIGQVRGRSSGALLADLVAAAVDIHQRPLAETLGIELPHGRITLDEGARINEILNKRGSGMAAALVPGQAPLSVPLEERGLPAECDARGFFVPGGRFPQAYSRESAILTAGWPVGAPIARSEEPHRQPSKQPSGSFPICCAPQSANPQLAAG